MMRCILLFCTFPIFSGILNDTKTIYYSACLVTVFIHSRGSYECNIYQLSLACHANNLLSPLLFAEPQDSGVYYLASYNYNNGTLESHIERNEYNGMSTKVLDSLRVMGVGHEITRITVNGNNHSDFVRLPSGEVQVNKLNLPIVQPFTVKFE